MTHADTTNPYATPGEPLPGSIPSYGRPSTYGQASPAYGAPVYGGASGYGAPDAYGYQSGGYAGYPNGLGVDPSQLASWGQRVGASLIDGLLAYSLLLPATIYAFSTATRVYDSFGNTVSVNTGAGNVALLIGYAWLLVVQIANRWTRQGRTGQSLGKRAVGIRLVNEATLQPIGAGNAFLRDVVHIADGFFYIGYLWPLWDAKKQTFADKAMRSLVLNG
jgi:uncharacterized RDD family membrane protein YckC